MPKDTKPYEEIKRYHDNQLEDVKVRRSKMSNAAKTACSQTKHPNKNEGTKSHFKLDSILDSKRDFALGRLKYFSRAQPLRMQMSVGSHDK